MLINSNSNPPEYAVNSTPILLTPKNNDTFFEAFAYLFSSLSPYILPSYDFSTNNASPITLQKNPEIIQDAGGTHEKNRYNLLYHNHDSLCSRFFFII